MKCHFRRPMLIALLCCSSVFAADKIKIGFISSLSGSGGALGVDIRDGFQLALTNGNNKLGGLPVELSVLDDQMNPDIGRQASERLIKRDRVDVMTGMVFSNVLLPLLPAILESDTVYISTNTGPADYAGEKCNENFFVISWQNEDLPGAMGKYVTQQNERNVFLIGANYPGGRESIAGFKRHYKGKIADEVYVKLGQLDFSAELAQARVSKADSVFFFLPGAMGSAFLKQMDSGGLNKTMRIYAPGFSGDQDSIKAVGEPMLGMYNASQWASDLDNAENAKFVRDFEKQYGRIPTMYAAQGYDAALLLDGAVRDVKGHIEDKSAFRKALRAANFKSVRGDFKFNRNHYPIHNIHMRVVERDKQGRISNRTVGMIAKDYSDPYAASCKMD
ncbi:ABC transporter substrate-binding protein [Verminephrobacter eiseniae]|uniref:ABC transporter substrate-binding protein n=1 Tax=Verminephrobacter eiseniae TaxID=364317 RepID=UPI002237F9D4|nr:ABC transporter substrate-binding protein [Verminephrobacter eiseniae]MCW5236671.1 ABC transporter substrate-binding protein [Verminephrobacter eiseniae]